MISLGWPAPAKLNLFLHITGQRQDGYHLLQTVFQFIQLIDVIDFTILESGLVRRSSTSLKIDERDDLVIKAAWRRCGDNKRHASPGAAASIKQIASNKEHEPRGYINITKGSCVCVCGGQ